jgi:hypothetical protein
LTPASPLAAGTLYTVDLTAGITDSSPNRNPLAPVSWSFTTASEPPQPTGAIALNGTAISASVTSGALVVLPSWAPAATGVVLLSVAQRDESKAISVSGNGLTWTQVANVDNVQGQGGIALWLGKGSSPVSGQITVTVAGNTLPVVAIAQRFSGVDTATPVEASATSTGPSVDDRNMLRSVATASANAWAVAAGWHRTAAFSLPAGESAVLLNGVAGSGGDVTRSSLWYEGPGVSPASVQLGGTNDLTTANDWAMVVVSLEPGGGAPPPPDSTAPSVVSVSPVAGAVGVPVTSVVSAVFDEDVVGVSGSTFTLRRGGVLVAASVGYASGSRSATLTPASPLAAGTLYTVDLTAGITDSSPNRNPLAPVTWSFTTAAGQPPPGGTYTFGPEADTWVYQASPSTAHGSETKVAIVASPSAKQAFLRFRVSGLPEGASVSSAKLRLVVTNDSTSGGVFNRITSTTWPESITWTTKPAIDGPQIASLGAVALSAVVEVDVTAYVTGNGTYSFAISHPSGNTNNLYYASREATTVANRPQLVVVAG